MISAEGVMVALTAILVVVTCVYAVLTHRIAKATERSVDLGSKQFESAHRAVIAITPRVAHKTHMFYLMVENVGRSVAVDLQLGIDKSYYRLAQKRPEKDLARANAFATPIRHFVPGARLVFELGPSFSIIGPESDPAVTPPRFTITAKYETLGAPRDEATDVDLSVYLNSAAPGDDTVAALEAIQESIAKKGAH